MIQVSLQRKSLDHAQADGAGICTHLVVVRDKGLPRQQNIQQDHTIVDTMLQQIVDCNIPLHNKAPAHSCLFQHVLFPLTRCLVRYFGVRDNKISRIGLENSTCFATKPQKNALRKSVLAAFASDTMQ